MKTDTDVCPICDGLGQISEGGFSLNEELNNWIKCDLCNGKGFVGEEPETGVETTASTPVSGSGVGDSLTYSSRLSVITAANIRVAFNPNDRLWRIQTRLMVDDGWWQLHEFKDGKVQPLRFRTFDEAFRALQELQALRDQGITDSELGAESETETMAFVSDSEPGSVRIQGRKIPIDERFATSEEWERKLAVWMETGSRGARRHLEDVPVVVTRALSPMGETREQRINNLQHR